MDEKKILDCFLNAMLDQEEMDKQIDDVAMKLINSVMQLGEGKQDSEKFIITGIKVHAKICERLAARLDEYSLYLEEEFSKGIE